MKISTKLKAFVQANTHKTPFLVVDLDEISTRYNKLVASLPNVACYYSVKSNPASAILSRLNSQGSRFEVASVGEIQACLDSGVTTDNIHFGNTIKSTQAIAKAYQLGINSFAFDCEEELSKLAEHAPQSTVVCRIVTDGKGAVWGLCHKFGCTVTNAIELLARANQLGFKRLGLSFHVGSQQQSPSAWQRALTDVKHIIDQLAKQGVDVNLINIGGGFPASGYLDQDDHELEFPFEQYGAAITGYIQTLFADRPELDFMCEPGRFLLSEAGCIKSEVILAAERLVDGNKQKWLYLDVGKFNGLYEATDIKMPVMYRESAQPLLATVLAGPSCDSDDMLSLPHDFHQLPADLDVGDCLVFLSTGAYSNSYLSIGFNGIPPLKEFYI